MASDQVLVNVSFREIPLFQSAVLHTVSATGAFLHTESPMPVGTMVILSLERAPEVKVPATVGLVVEACRGVKPAVGELPGMNLVFEAGGEQMLDHLEDLSAQAGPAVLAASPGAPVAPVLPRRLDPTPPVMVSTPAPVLPSFEEVPTKVERRVVAAAPAVEAPPLQPAASGSLTVESASGPAVGDEPSVIVTADLPDPAGDHEPDPDGPDKVIYELDAEYSPSSPDDGEGEGEEGEGEGEGEGEAKGDDGKPKKKRSRSRRRKKR
jgi:hypothetical protein